MHKKDLEKYPVRIRNERSLLPRKEQIKLMNMEDHSNYNQIYLVGEDYDYYKIAFVDPWEDECLKFELKVHDDGCSMHSPPWINGNLTKIVTPKEAIKLLKKCTYKTPEGNKIPKPHKETLRKVLEILHRRH